MSIFDFLLGTRSDEPLYSDTNSDGDTDPYMYRLEDDGSYTPVTRAEYKAHTDQLYRDGYYDDLLAKYADEPKKGWFGLW